MPQTARTMTLVALAAVAMAILTPFVMPGCAPTQNQDNSPISISNVQGRPALAVTCSTDGSVAYLTDGRNVYRYERRPTGQTSSWECILSQGERQEMAVRHDPREQQALPGAPDKAAQEKSEIRNSKPETNSKPK